MYLDEENRMDNRIDVTMQQNEPKQQAFMF